MTFAAPFEVPWAPTMVHKPQFRENIKQRRELIIGMRQIHYDRSHILMLRSGHFRPLLLHPLVPHLIPSVQSTLALSGSMNNLAKFFLSVRVWRISTQLQCYKILLIELVRNVIPAPFTLLPQDSQVNVLKFL
jgi:hypothetical protein